MWDETKETSLHQLRQREAEGSLTESERGELGTLVQVRCQHEEAAIEESTRRTEAENVRLDAQIQHVEAQNRALKSLIQEQETYLAEVQSRRP